MNDVYNMSDKMQEGAAKLLRKVYKHDMTVSDRTKLTSQLFDKKFPKYSWQVLTNSSAWYLSKDIHISMTIDNDEFTVFGNEV